VSAATVLACPSCASRLPAASPAFLDCPSCASPLAVFVEGEPVREAILPALSREQAVAAARAFWTMKWVPRAFGADGTLEEPILVFAPFFESETTASSGRKGSRGGLDRLVRSPAVAIPGIPLAAVDVEAVLGEAKRVPFDPSALQRRGLVFDPGSEPPARGENIVEERLSVVWIPVWLVRCRFARNLYEAAVDGTTGTVLSGRAPTERSARLHEAIGFVYLLAFLIGMPVRAWGALFEFLSNFDQVGLVAALFIPGLLVWLLVFAWDRTRFRYEWYRDGRAMKLVAINRPEKTLPEKVRDGLFKVAAWVASR